MAVTFMPQPPSGRPQTAGGAVPTKNAARPKSAAPAISSSVAEILKTVTPNYVMTAVIKNRLQEGQIKAQRKKRKTRAEILAAMDLRELQMERLAMARMGFLDKAKEVEQWIERERVTMQKEREEKEQSILTQKLNSLDMGHRRRMVGLESRLTQELQQFLSKCAKELADTKDKHKREYDMLIEETAQRAYGGVSSCQCRRKYLCRHNKTASYNTRKPTRDVISLRQNAERLRATGRVEEAEEFDRQAQVIDDKADKDWRTRVEQSIVSSAWSGGKSRLEQLVERQQHTLKSVEETHEAKLELVKKQQEIQRRNLKSTFEAERKKVTMYCRRAALKRMTRDIKEDAEEDRRIMAQKSDGMQNVSRNMISKDDDTSDSEEESDDGQGIGWIAPTASGIDNSEAIAKYDDLKTGKIYEEIEEIKRRGIQIGAVESVATYTAVEATIGEQTSGSRLNDAFRIARQQNEKTSQWNAAQLAAVPSGSAYVPPAAAPGGYLPQVATAGNAWSSPGAVSPVVPQMGQYTAAAPLGGYVQQQPAYSPLQTGGNAWQQQPVGSYASAPTSSSFGAYVPSVAPGSYAAAPIGQSYTGSAQSYSPAVNSGANGLSKAPVQQQQPQKQQQQQDSESEYEDEEGEEEEEEDD